MTDFEDHGLSAGIWSGVLRRENAPARVLLTHLGRPVAEAQLSPAADGEWRVSAGISSDLLSDGLQCFLLMAEPPEAGPEGAGAEHLASLTVLAGVPLDQDIHAEVELLRAEIDMLKREMRRLATREA
ncbi:hypothetical protein FNJ84_07725 [Paracoccus sp. M683]|uniref:hypothetical protein n=1 Tax=Paracoccus sp. M683 TaxID=2594268 RepID=UPI00117E8504|nr:hypothetical protein [Paracoccus sp. M683]TRW97396.1 hypothetical protein FNJ84_07725 [Paracoccus sp. M683]